MKLQGIPMMNRATMLLALTKFNEQITCHGWESIEHKGWGICSNIDVIITAAQERSGHEDRYEIDGHSVNDSSDKSNLLLACFESWPKYSGNEAYPVPDPADVEFICSTSREDWTPDDYNNLYHHASNMYSGRGAELWDGERFSYAALRMELLAHCIEYLAGGMTQADVESSPLLKELA